MEEKYHQLWRETKRKFNEITVELSLKVHCRLVLQTFGKVGHRNNVSTSLEEQYLISVKPQQAVLINTGTNEIWILINKWWLSESLEGLFVPYNFSFYFYYNLYLMIHHWMKNFVLQFICYAIFTVHPYVLLTNTN